MRNHLSSNISFNCLSKSPNLKVFVIIAKDIIQNIKTDILNNQPSLLIPYIQTAPFIANKMISFLFMMSARFEIKPIFSLISNKNLIFSKGTTTK